MKISKIGIILRGMAMGVAEVIPGVSGGTIAFISGIYETLLESIRSVDIEFFSLLLKGEFKKAFTKINIGFLLNLVIGMGVGLVVSVFTISYLLENYPEPLWAFFFGLILASVPFMLRQVKDRNIKTLLIFLIGAVVAYMITSLNPVVGITNYAYIFFAGAIAICALVLPGISGSFILLLLGLYSLIIPTLKSFLKSPDMSGFIILAVFGMGCIVGLALISRLVSKAFKKYHDGTLALLSGFMLGSLNKIWPWRNVQTIVEKETGNPILLNESNYHLLSENSDNYKILTESNVLPDAYMSDPRTILVVIAVIVGIITIQALSHYQSTLSKAAE